MEKLMQAVHLSPLAEGVAERLKQDIPPQRTPKGFEPVFTVGDPFFDREWSLVVNGEEEEEIVQITNYYEWSVISCVPYPAALPFLYHAGFRDIPSLEEAGFYQKGEPVKHLNSQHILVRWHRPSFLRTRAIGDTKLEQKSGTHPNVSSGMGICYGAGTAPRARNGVQEGADQTSTLLGQGANQYDSYARLDAAQKTIPTRIEISFPGQEVDHEEWFPIEMNRETMSLFFPSICRTGWKSFSDVGNYSNYGAASSSQCKTNLAKCANCPMPCVARSANAEMPEDLLPTDEVEAGDAVMTQSGRLASPAYAGFINMHHPIILDHVGLLDARAKEGLAAFRSMFVMGLPDVDLLDPDQITLISAPQTASSRFYEMLNKEFHLGMEKLDKEELEALGLALAFSAGSYVPIARLGAGAFSVPLNAFQTKFSNFRFCQSAKLEKSARDGLRKAHYLSEESRGRAMELVHSIHTAKRKKPVAQTIERTPLNIDIDF